MSRQVFLLGVGIVLIGLGFALTNRILFQPGITEENAGRIRTGMSRAQVEAILGGPADNRICATNIKTVSTNPKASDDAGGRFSEWSYGWTPAWPFDTWTAPGITIDVGFQDGKVFGLFVNGEDRSSSLKGFRARLGW